MLKIVDARVAGRYSYRVRKIVAVRIGQTHNSYDCECLDKFTLNSCGYRLRMSCVGDNLH